MEACPRKVVGRRRPNRIGRHGGYQWGMSRLEKARQFHLRRRFQQEELPEIFLCFSLLAHS